MGTNIGKRQYPAKLRVVVLIWGSGGADSLHKTKAHVSFIYYTGDDKISHVKLVDPEEAHQD